MNPDHEKDRDDLALLRTDDERALNRLIGRWERPLFAFAWRYVQNATDARELVAELFVRLHSHREKLRPETNLAAWLFTALSNLCHNQHRWRRRHPSVSLEHVEHTASGTGANADLLATTELGPAALLDRDETLAAVGAAVDGLPHDLKIALLLHYYEGRSLREIGVIAGCSERGVETRLYRARQRLRQLLGAHLKEELRVQS